MGLFHFYQSVILTAKQAPQEWIMGRIADAFAALGRWIRRLFRDDRTEEQKIWDQYW